MLIGVIEDEAGGASGYLVEMRALVARRLTDKGHEGVEVILHDFVGEGAAGECLTLLRARSRDPRLSPQVEIVALRPQLYNSVSEAVLLECFEVLLFDVKWSAADGDESGWIQALKVVGEIGKFKLPVNNDSAMCRVALVTSLDSMVERGQDRRVPLPVFAKSKSQTPGAPDLERCAEWLAYWCSTILEEETSSLWDLGYELAVTWNRGGPCVAGHFFEKTLEVDRSGRNLVRKLRTNAVQISDGELEYLAAVLHDTDEQLDHLVRWMGAAQSLGGMPASVTLWKNLFGWHVTLRDGLKRFQLPRSANDLRTSFTSQFGPSVRIDGVLANFRGFRERHIKLVLGGSDAGGCLATEFAAALRLERSKLARDDSEKLRGREVQVAVCPASEGFGGIGAAHKGEVFVPRVYVEGALLRSDFTRALAASSHVRVDVVEALGRRRTVSGVQQSHVFLVVRWAHTAVGCLTGTHRPYGLPWLRPPFIELVRARVFKLWLLTRNSVGAEIFYDLSAEEEVAKHESLRLERADWVLDCANFGFVSGSEQLYDNALVFEFLTCGDL